VSVEPLSLAHFAPMALSTSQGGCAGDWVGIALREEGAAATSTAAPAAAFLRFAGE
jgi:hypothetical protein